MYAYSLTDYTGARRNQNRSMVVATMEVNRFGVFVSAVAAAVGLMFGTLLSLLFGSYLLVLVVVPGMVVAARWLVLGRSRRGLQVSRARRELYRFRAGTGVFHMNGRVMSAPTWVLFQPVVVDIPRAPATVPVVGRSSNSGGSIRRSASDLLG